MKIKPFISFFIILSMCISLWGCTQKTDYTVFLDSDGNEIGKITSKSGSIEVVDFQNTGYVIEAVLESISALSKEMKIDEKAAKAELFENSYIIHTYLQNDIQSKVAEVLNNGAGAKLSAYSVAVTDLTGGIIASVSTNCDTEELLSDGTEKHYPCSAIKPLSVYAPLLDKGVINWSSVQTDMPVKTIEGENWPVNPSGIYTGESVTVADALKDSYNTIAVKWLQELTAAESCEFLTRLGFDVSEEKQIADSYGDDEVLGNLGLGYLRSGVTTAEMAGYYQIFAAAGEYTKPVAVREIELNGKIVYTPVSGKQQIIKPATAHIMNRLLQEVVNDGTGKEASIQGIPVSGKTGTSSGFADNWFVGLTPQYSCAVWHNAYAQEDGTSNIAPRIFAEIFKSLVDEGAAYPHCSEVQQLVFCPESGQGFSEKCTRIGRGYYLSAEQLAPCNIH